MKKIISFASILLLLLAFVGCQRSTLSTTTSATISSSNTTTQSSTTSSSTTTSTTTTSSTTTTTTTEQPTIETLEIYAVNDLHGLAYFDSSNFQNSLSAFAKLGKYVKDQQTRQPNSLFIASGDILQGSAFSNYYYGLPMIEALNAMNFDAFTIGNHEFDWGIDKVANYADGIAENGEANFPFLAANIVYKGTTTPLPFTQPYLIKTVGSLKVGVIGVIGDVYTSIAPARVADVEFLDYVEVIRHYTHYLRTQEEVDIVIVSIHGYELGRNQEIASSRGDYLVDAILNAHTHSNLSQYINRTDTRLPYVQTNATTSNMMAKIVLTYDHQEQRVTEAYASLVGLNQMSTEDSYLRTVLDTFANDSEYIAFVTDVLTNNLSYASTSELAVWGASVIRDYMQVDIGLLNSGGFRKAMPTGNITMGFLVEVYPFDNNIKMVTLRGSVLINLAQSTSLIFDDQFNINQIVSDQMYRVATVDYVFDQDRYPFLNGQDPELTEVLLRTLLVQDLRASNNAFRVSDGTSY